jgi:nitroreductase
MADDLAEMAISLTDHTRFLITTAARAPSVHNTQPWRFRVSAQAVELWCDPGRKLKADAAGREMLISCGAALFGLRLAVRSLGVLPVTELLPDPARLRLLARVRVGAAVPAQERELRMLRAVPHRHTHRGPFDPGPLPAGLVAGLQHDAFAEGATLALIDGGLPYQRLAGFVAEAARRGDRDSLARAETRRWTRGLASTARDGVPALAFAADPGRRPGTLRQRDFDLGRGLGRLGGGGAPPPATAVLLTGRDSRASWLRAGQALQRLLLHAAAEWVFASLHTQPLEHAATRRLIQERLALPGRPQMVLQLGRATTAPATARLGPEELAGP